jgi:hypothetical protein
MMRIRLWTSVAALLSLPWGPAAALPGGAALTLPGAGPVADVAQTPFRDGFAQRITFRGDPRGVAEVSVRNGGTGGGFGSALALAKPSRAGIAAELRARFPGESMRIVTEARRNAYGPVGLALGNDCLYAWQWIDLGAGRQVTERDGRRGSGPTLFGDGGSAASIRIKLCRTATATLSDLARAVEGMRFSAAPGDAPLAQDASAARARVRQAPPPRRAPPASAAAKAPERAAPPPGAMERPREAQRNLVPGPGAPPPRSVAPAPPVPAVSGSVQSPRYITDAAPGAGSPVIAVPKPAPNRAEVEELLSRELPARAYRPPP